MATRRSTSKEENGEGVARKESATPAPEESNSEGRLNIESNVTSSNVSLYVCYKEWFHIINIAFFSLHF